jgi:hypothetical protein
MGVLSFMSPSIPLSSYVTVHPIGFAVHLQMLNKAAESALSLTEELAIEVDFFSVSLMEVIGHARVSLSVMVEDACNIIRQDVEVLRQKTGILLGTAVVDVRGYRLLQKFKLK